MIVPVPVSQPSLSAVERQLVIDCIDSNRLTYGDVCRLFEQQLADMLDVKHVVVTSSGTTALHLALVALGVGPGDEVIIPDLTFVATGNAVLYTGATPVVVDVDPGSWCIDTDKIMHRISPRTKAVIIVHLYGVSCDMQDLYDLLPMDVAILEDAAEGFGGSYSSGPYKGCALGSRNLSTFSFYGNKIVTTGEGGAVATSRDAMAERLRFLRGQAMSPTERYMHTDVGYNYRMTELQAAIGLGQLSRFHELVSARQAVVDRYRSNLDYEAPCTRLGSAPWLYTLLLDSPADRDIAIKALTMAGVDTRPCFVPMHLMPMFKPRDGRTYPVASSISSRALSLPTYPDLPLQTVDMICDTLKGVLDA